MLKKSENIDYLYDFMYADTRRIYSYLSQIDPTGVVTAIKEVVGDSSLSDTSGEINTLIVKAALKGTSSNSQSLEHQFDATPTLPWTLLHKLHEMGYLSEDINKTPIGRMVLLKGSINLIDLRILKEVWGPISLQRSIEQEMHFKEITRSSTTSREEKENAEKGLRTIKDREQHEKVTVELMSKIPHTVNLTLFSGENKFWSSLQPSCFLFDPEDMILKHGPQISGEWYVAAIVDALPGAKGDHPFLAELSDFRELSHHLTEVWRYRFGRPADFYALTPIAIYRAVQRP